MLSTLRDFAARHRKKLIVTSVLVGGSYLAYTYAQRRLVQFQDDRAKEFLEKTRRIQHFESTERTCNQVIIGMCTELSQAITRECNTDVILEQLHQNPPNKVVLWEQLKIVSFTRLTTFIYASSMLVIALRIQMNLLGGYLYRDITKDNKKITDDIKQQYLSLIRHFIHEGGVTDLIHFIQAKVTTIMKSLPLSKMLSLADMEQVFWSLQMAINSDPEEPISRMSKYLLPPRLPEYNSGGTILQKMFNETLDLLESDDASSICSNNVCRGFSLAVDAIETSLTLSVTSNKSETDEAAKLKTVLNVSVLQVPVARLIPIICKLMANGFDSKSSPENFTTSLTSFFVVAEKSKMLGANIYESFCSSTY